MTLTVASKVPLGTMNINGIETVVRLKIKIVLLFDHIRDPVARPHSVCQSVPSMVTPQ